MVVFHGGDADLNLKEFVEDACEEGATCPVGFNAQGYHLLCDAAAAPNVDQIQAYATLADKMHEYAWSTARNENPNIPAGYTYLFQLVAHDLTHTSIAFHGPKGLERRTDNMRARGLWFDTLFGGGPDICPLAYTPWKSEEDKRGHRKLKLGPEREGEAMRDLARARFTEAGLYESGRPDEVLIADRRNEDNAILAQLTALLHLYYNRLVQEISERSLDFRPGQMPEDYARAVAAHALREITWYDLCFRLMHKDVWKYYETKEQNSSYFDEWQGGFSVPLEFAAGVARMGHAMVRTEYRLSSSDLNEQTATSIVSHSSARINRSELHAELPLPDSWMIEWSRFFDLGDTTAQRAFAFELSGNKFLNTEKMVPSGLGDGRDLGLPFRDLARAGFLGVPDVLSIADFLTKMRKLHDPDGSLEALFNKELSPDAIRGATGEALHTLWGPAPLPAAIEKIADRPPLLVYLLADAWKGSGDGGGNMGVMASTLLGEVVHKARRNAENANPWAKEIVELASQIHGDPPSEFGQVLKVIGL